MSVVLGAAQYTSRPAHTLHYSWLTCLVTLLRSYTYCSTIVERCRGPVISHTRRLQQVKGQDQSVLLFQSITVQLVKK